MAVDNKYDGLEIAITGISGRFPGSNNYRQFWKNLQDGKELIRTFTDEELRQEGVPEAELQDKRYVKSVGVVDNKDLFDPGFFGYNAEEASLMDPQIRLFHEHCWEALEDAGYSSLTDKHKIGLYAGASLNDNWRIYAQGRSATSSLQPFYSNMITAHRFISTLISYKLNLRGPSIFIDTACSTSLVAVHLACRGLWTKDCTIALAGGISLKTLKGKGYLYEEGMVSSVDGHCRAFDARAGGTASGEGSGVVVLKRLSEAVKDRDHIYAVIRSIAVNNDGNLKVGYTAPSVKGQADCIRAAHKLAGLDLRSITYIEAHGTATKLGDPVEIRALNEAFGVGGGDKYCALGSVKSNMGHLDAAAGVAGLIKVALSLKHRQIPASLNFTEPNPDIDFDGGPFYVNTELKEWDRKGNYPLRAGLSSLGIGGTNAHVILEEAPEAEEGEPGRTYKLLTVSAKTEGSISRYLGNLGNFLAEEPGINLADLSYTLQACRRHFVYRKAIVYKDRDDLVRSLNAGSADQQVIKSKESRNQAVFLFSGAGSQYSDMGKDLYDNENVFRAEMEKGFGLLKTLTGDDYKEIFYPERPGDNRINNMLHAQPAIFLFEYSLARLMMSYGIIPEYMIGHSVGEYVAACLNGVFSYEDALKLVVKRGELMNRLAHGAMLSVALEEEKAREYINDEISLAAVNGPGQVVFSGNLESISVLTDNFGSKDIPCTRLHATHAGHSYMMDEILEPYRMELEKISMNAPRIPFLSCLTGDFITSEECKSAAYWVRHMRETVRFSDGITTICARGKDLVFVEIGAGNALTTLLRQRNTKEISFTAMNMVRHPKESENDMEYLTGRLGQLWAQGISPDWDLYHKDEKRRKVSLPVYSFEPETYPAEVDPFEDGTIHGAHLTKPGKKQGLEDRIYYPSWKRSVPYSSGAVTHRKGYLFFSFDKKFSLSVKADLTRNGDEFIEVFMGKEFTILSDDQYSVNPARPGDFDQLVSSLQNDKIVITHIIYSWGMAAGSFTLELTADNKGINTVYFSVVSLLKALLRINNLKEKRFAILTDSLHKVLGTEKVRYTQSLLLGLVKVIPQEFSVPCCNIDLDMRENTEDFVRSLVEEINSNNGRQDRIVALRHGQRWIQDYEKHGRPIHPGQSLIKEGGVYLITGGLGNVGFSLSKYLIQNYDVKIVLAGRKELGEHNEGSGVSSDRLRHLKRIGKDVRYFKVDVSDGEGLKRMVEDVENGVGTIQGVIHTAGITDDNYFELIEDMTPEKALAMFGPKVKGVENIYGLFRNRKPDFVWITSSLASTLGGLSYCSYSSANSFMEHFISSLSNDCRNWKCVCLEGLSFSDGEVEAAGIPDQADQKAKEMYELFEWSLSAGNNPVILQATVDLPARIEKSYDLKTELRHDRNFSGNGFARLGRPELNTNYTEPGTATERRLKDIFETFLGIEGIGVEDHFFDLGGDSLKGMVLLKRINMEFSINLPLRELLTNTTIRLMAAKIDENLWLEAENKMENEITI
jgi:acyl transferase domain-containing protein/acyl carrier protein